VLLRRRQYRVADDQAKSVALAKSIVAAKIANCRGVLLRHLRDYSTSPGASAQEELVHLFLGEKTTTGLLVHLQARLLARCLRGDLDAYPPFIWQ
jgi:CRISPR/Cas system-associated endonuclease Cas1